MDYLKLDASPCFIQITSITPVVPWRNLRWDYSDYQRPYSKTMAELRAEGLGQPQSMPPWCCAYMLLHSQPRSRMRVHAAAPSANQGSDAIKNYSLLRDVGETPSLEVFKMWLGRVLK